MTNDDDNADVWMTASDAVKHFGVAHNTIYRIGRGTSAQAARQVRTRVMSVNGNGTSRVFHKGDLAQWFAREAREDLPVAGSASEVVYVIALDPEARPGRVKVGCSTRSAQDRLMSFRTVAPEAVILEVFYVPINCEGFALALAHVLSHNRMSEVFEFTPETLHEYIERLRSAFSPWAEND